MDWTPTPRRPTAMRRAQNLALVSAVVSGAVVASGLILLLIARVNPDTALRLRLAATDMAAPIWSVARAPFDALGTAGDAIGDYFGAASRVARLEAELDKANQRLRAARAGQRELIQLKQLMQVREPTRRVIATTRIAAATGGAVRSAILAVGAADGVRRDMPVIGADGLIGRTVEAGQHSARVLLLTDPLSRVPVIVERTGQAGLAAGRNLPTLLLIDRVGADVPLLDGDRLVTTGDDGVFPPGVPVGVVVDARGADGPVVRPAAQPIGAGFVDVEAAWLPVPGATPRGPVFDAPVPVEARRKGAPPPRLRGQDSLSLSGPASGASTLAPAGATP